MSIAEPSDKQYGSPSASHQALQAALQTLKERCQSFQKRIAALEQENGTLRTLHTKAPAATATTERFHERQRATNQTELERLRENVSELTQQKLQMTEHISMMTSENRQLWKRLSVIVKDLTAAVPETIVNVGQPNTTLVTVNQPRAQAPNQPGQNLIRSRTFTKHAPNPKLRERSHRDGSSDEDGINLEDVSLLNTCGFLETESDAGLPPLGAASTQDDEHELNLYYDRCTDELLQMQKDVAQQQQIMKDVLNRLNLTKELCHRCTIRQAAPDSKKLMKDVTVEVAESELQPVEKQQQQPSTDGGYKPQPAPRESTYAYQEKNEPTSSPEVVEEAVTGKGSCIDLLLEKLRANGVEKICPICGRVSGPDTMFDEFQRHVEAHFLGDGEMDEHSLDRTYEYASQTVGDF